MGAYQDFKPTGWDAAGLGIYDERAGWTVAPVGRNRDSNGRENARFRALLRAMEATGPEAADDADYREWDRYRYGGFVSKPDPIWIGDWQVHRFGHWACGWFELVICRPGSKAERRAKRFGRRRDF